MFSKNCFEKLVLEVRMTQAFYGPEYPGTSDIGSQQPAGR